MIPLISTLLPLAIQYVVPLMEKIFGGKKAPTDTQTGTDKMNNAIAILQQLSAAKGVSGTSDELKNIIQMAVDSLKPLGLDKLSTDPNATIGVPNVSIPLTSAGAGVINLTFTGAIGSIQLAK